MTGPAPGGALGAVRGGDPVAVVLAPDGRVTLATAHGAVTGDAADVRRLEAACAPRWVWWSAASVAPLLTAVPVGRAWDLAAVHRLLHGGWRADPGVMWALAHGLDPGDVPMARPPDLFHPALDPAELDEPIDPDGHLRPEWPAGEWAATEARRMRWARLALDVAARQRDAIAALSAAHPQARSTAHAESAAEVLCVELAARGLPIDRGAAESILTSIVGPRPATAAEAEAQRAARDAEVLRHAPTGMRADLRNPAHVRTLLRSIGVEVSDTRGWRLEQLRDAHPLVPALLAWRRAERIATTYGYAWLDGHVGADGRLRGQWSASDGAAGRMTATAGLHNLPADLRPAVAAEPGHVLVRADLGQVEPRVLAVVSGDRELARAAAAGDLYAPVAAQLGVDRPAAKVAVLGAMYGQVAGHGAQMQRRLAAAYPVAMRYLEAAAAAGEAGRPLRTYGGRLVRFDAPGTPDDVADRERRARAAALGRYARNAMIQGAAAELFKRWAVTVRARLRASLPEAEIVLCLHDELLVHVPERHGEAVAGLLEDCLQETATAWAPGSAVRFVADVAVVRRWSDAT